MTYLYENKNIPSVLEPYIKNTTSLHSYFEITFDGIRPKNYCGFLAINDESYFIIPKIADEDTQNLNTFIYMLIYAYDIKLKNEDLMNADNMEHKIFELFIRLFADTLLDEFKRGVFKQYITMQENLKVLRGKYIIEKNFNNFYHQNIYCEYDEFSMDNELNRFFLYAIRTFTKFSSYGNLHRCEAVLDEVDYFNVDFKRLNIHFDRMSSRYKKSYEVALMILQRLVPTIQKSTDKSFAFLFDMADVFEKFVGKMYVAIDSSTNLKYSKSYGKLHLKPDILTSDKVIDIKYKIPTEKGKVSRDDKYQMFVYGTNIEAKRDTVLLYPKHTNDKKLLERKLELGEGDNMVRLEMRSLDLEFDGGYIEYINKIRNRLENVR